MELKARVPSLDPVRQRLVDRGARFVGTDHQRDTYFNSAKGRLKIRQGTIESCFVWYERPDIEAIRQCAYHLVTFDCNDPALEAMRAMFAAALGILVIVEKDREIYYIDNAKFHLDAVNGLGYFTEIEIIGDAGDDPGMLGEQCEQYREQLGIERAQLVAASYADLIKQKHSKQ